MWGTNLTSMFLVFAMAFLLPFFATAAGDLPADEAKKNTPNDEAGAWYFFTGNVNNHPRLKEADRMTDQQINQPLRLLAPGFEDVRTFSDQRDEFMIWTPFIGVGRQLSLHWDLFYQAGYTAGRVRTHETYPSLLLLPLHDDVTIYRSSIFTGLGLAYYPWEFPELRHYTSLKDRLKASRPFIGTTLSYNYMTYEAKIKLGLLPFSNLIRMTQKDQWYPFSSGIMMGADVPLTKSSALSFNLQYTFFWTQGDDFSGPGFSMMWKRFF